MKCQVRIVIVVSIICTVLCWPCETVANEKSKRVVGPIKTYVLSDLEQCDANWLQLKFSERCDVEIFAGRDINGVGSFNDLNGVDITAINQIVSSATEITPTFHGDRERFRQYKLNGEARSGSEGPDLGLWFNVRFASRKELVEKLNQLNGQEHVEIAHPIPEVADAYFMMPGGTPDFSVSQGYLYDTPLGLDAPAAWALPGGRGANVKFIDVERGWYSNHEDFNQGNFFFNGMSSNPGQTFDHGTAVLGEVIGSDNEFGVIGFASDASWGTVAYPTFAGSNVSASFLEAAEALEPGDVWLIEIQMFPPGLGATPMEYLQANYDAIWTSSFALDVICVEAGANGGQNLDSVVFNGMFDRNVRDSGAILVAAGRPNLLIAEGFSNYGSRMDAHAWGSSITTSGYGSLFGFTNTTSYTGDFGGTSGASPMIVGTSLCLQGIHKARTGNYLSPIEMRQLIAATGTPHNDTVREIGPRPDIAAAIKQLPEACLFGDVNQDENVNLLDVAPFIAAITDSEFQCEADANQDGSVDLLDVEGFVAILSGS